jgi:D-glycero-beta-D-manno-heptose 1-phosphate adenylyltransferase
MSALPLFDKLFGREDVQAFARLPRPLVFTNGVFDILHRGHVSYLAAARALGASLVVGLNSDSSARALGKGPDRPLNGEIDRACVLAALQAVNAVVLFDEPTPLALLDQCRPDIYVKGGDYDIEQLPETPLVRSWGGRALALPFVAGYSTTALVQRIARGA